MILTVISTISQFWSPTLTTSWQSVFVFLFSMVYIPHPPTNIFFVGLEVFLHLQARGWENFKFLGGPSVLGGTNILFGRGDQAIFFHKAISIKLFQENLMAKLSISCVYANFSPFQLRNFRLRIFCRVQVSIQTFKKVFTIVW